MKLALSFIATILVASLSLTGCFGGDTDGCEYWIGQLAKKKRTKKAIQKIGEYKCADGMDVLKEHFPDSLYRREILSATKSIGKTDAGVEIVSSALPDKEIGPLAITMAIDWKVSGIEKSLERLIRSQRSASTRKQALEALVQLSSPEKNVETLVWAVGQEPTLQGVDTNAFAADQLAKLDWSKQKADFATKTARSLVRALFMKDSTGNSAQINARMALRAIGPPSMEPILSAFRGTNADFNEFAEIRGLPKWRYTQGHELVEMLWDVGDRRASPALMESMGIALDPPPPDVARLPEDQRDEWKNANSNRLTSTALTVGALKNDEAVKYAVALLGRKNPPPDASQFVKTGLALALMGTPASRAALWKLFNSGDEQAAIYTAKIAKLKTAVTKEGNKAKKKALMKEHDDLIDKRTKAKNAKANFVTNLAVGLGPEDTSQFKSKIMGAEKGAVKESAAQPLPRAYYGVVEKCGRNLNCYKGILEARKGKTDAIPKSISAAQDKLKEAKKALKEKAKPWKTKIKAKNKEVAEKYKGVLKLRKEIDALKGKQKEYNAGVKKFNAALDAMKVIETERDKLYVEYNKVVATIDPVQEAVTKTMIPLYELEKAVLMLGAMKGGEKHLELIATVFAETNPAYFAQFRQWAIISLEHLATKDNVKTIQDLLNKESDDGKKSTFWSLRLESLLQRIKRG